MAEDMPVPADRNGKIRVGVSSLPARAKRPLRRRPQAGPLPARTPWGATWSIVPVCPEVECGLPVPREAMRLVGDPDSPRLVTIRTREDLTERMLSWAGRRVRELEREGLCGFIFKSRSPSCGMERVKVYSRRGCRRKSGWGCSRRPSWSTSRCCRWRRRGGCTTPSCGRTSSSGSSPCSRWRELLAGARNRRDLVEFHTRNKLLLMAHSPKHLREMGRLVAQAASLETRRRRSTGTSGC